MPTPPIELNGAPRRFYQYLHGQSHCCWKFVETQIFTACTSNFQRFTSLNTFYCCGVTIESYRIVICMQRPGIILLLYGDTRNVPSSYSCSSAEKQTYKCACMYSCDVLLSIYVCEYVCVNQKLVWWGLCFSILPLKSSLACSYVLGKPSRTKPWFLHG